MHQQQINKKNNWVLIVFLIAWFLVNLSFLTQFPFMHSDETWLSTLSRNMMTQGDFGVTESVFDLVPRYPHAIKIVFHVIQIAFIKVFSYELFSVRLVSLIFGTATIYFFYQLLDELVDSKWLAGLGTLLLALDVQFVYAAHLARAEALLMMMLVLALWLVIRWRDDHEFKHDMLLGCLLGVSIGIHPNSLFLALAIGFVYLWQWRDGNISFRNILLLILVVSLFAGFFVGFSYLFDSEFIPHYLSFGSTLGVAQTFGDKLKGLIPYFERLFNGVSGTYYTPDIRLPLVIFAVVVGLSILVGIRKKQSRKNDLLFGLLGLLLGMVFVGRFSQPSVIFIFLICYALFIAFVDGSRLLRNALLILVICVMGVNTIREIEPYLNHDYDNYLSEIRAVVPEDAVVLANLNTEFVFEADHLFDYRNLAGLEENVMSFSDYIDQNQIEYILYPEEMDFIYVRRPAWNVMYGNLYPYYDDMQDFLNEDCELIGNFDTPYAMRIIRFMSDQDWVLKIYQVK